MKVTQVNTHLTGGAAKACIRLHNGLNGLDKIKSNLLYRTGSLDRIKGAFKYKAGKFWSLKEYGFLVKEKCHVKNHKNLECFEIPQTPFQINNERLIKYADIINLHWVSNFLNYSDFFDKVKTPIVWTLHDMQPFTGGIPYIDSFPIEKYKKELTQNVSLKKEAMKGCKITVVCPSNWIKRISEKSELFSKFKHVTINNGVDTSIFKQHSKNYLRTKFNIPESTKLILFICASLKNVRKGVSYAMEALKKLESQDFKLCLVGAGNFDFTELDHSLLLFLGEVSSENKLSKIYSACDLMLLPSLEDNLPNTAIEALCCGTPIVGFRSGGIEEILDCDNNGVLVEKGNVIDFAFGIDYALSKEWNYEAISKNGKRLYNIENQATAYLNLYNSIL